MFKRSFDPSDFNLRFAETLPASFSPDLRAELAGFFDTHAAHLSVGDPLIY